VVIYFFENIIGFLNSLVYGYNAIITHIYSQSHTELDDILGISFLDS
jgi:hypothetical protein